MKGKTVYKQQARLKLHNGNIWMFIRKWWRCCIIWFCSVRNRDTQYLES